MAFDKERLDNQLKEILDFTRKMAVKYGGEKLQALITFIETGDDSKLISLGGFNA